MADELKSIFDMDTNYVEEVHLDEAEGEQSIPLEPTDSNGLNNHFMSRNVAQTEDNGRRQEELYKFFDDPEEDDREEEIVRQEHLKLGDEVAAGLDKPEEVEPEEGEEKKEPKVEFPVGGRILFGGILDAAQGTINFGIDVADFVDNKLGADVIPDDFKVEALSKLIPRGNSFPENMSRGIVSFLVPFAGISKIAKGVKVVSRAATLTKSAAIGAGADMLAFDPDEKNLSGLIQDIPSLRNPITEYLATGDSRLEKRIKNGLEGIGVSGIAEATMSGIKFYRNARLLKKNIKAKGALEAEVPEAGKKLLMEEFNDSMKVLSNDKSPDAMIRGLKALDAIETQGLKVPKGSVPKLVEDSAVKAMRELAKGGLAGNRAINIKLTKFSMREESRKAFKVVAKLDKKSINEARRGVLHEADIRTMADETGLTVDDILSLKEGDTFNAEQMLSARNTLAASAEALVSVAQRTNNKELPLTDFIDALDLHRGLQAKVSGAIAESGRALQSMKFEVLGASGAERLRTVADIINHHGEDNLVNLARYVGEMDLAQINRVAKKSMTQKAWDAALEVRVNGLLSSPRTTMTNVISNSMTTLSAPIETAWARGISKIRGTNAFEGEASEQMMAIVNGFADALRVGKESFKRGTFSDASKLNYLTQRAVSAEAFDAKGNFGRAIDLIGDTIRVPGKMLMSTDEFFKSINYRMEVQKLWARRSKSLRESGLNEAQISARFENFVNTSEVKMQAADFARYNTFTNPLPPDSFSANAEKALKSSPLGRLLFPFTRTNFNIIRFSMERTPALGAMLPEVRTAWTKGGAARDMVIAKQSFGGAILGTAATLAYNGTVTGSGPGHPDASRMWKEAGNQAYSLKVGDRFYAYNRLDPLGSIFALGADIGQLASYAEEQDIQYSEYASAAALAVGHLYTPEFLVDQVGQLIDIMVKGDQSAMERFMTDQPSTFIPFSSALRDIRRDVDPFRRVTRDKNKTPLHRVFEGAINKMADTIPGLSSSLPMRRNRLGDPVMYPIGWTPEIISPIATSEKKPGIVYEEIVRLGLASPLTRVEKKDGKSNFTITQLPRLIAIPSIGSYPLNMEQQSKFAELAAGIGLLDGNGNQMPLLKEALENEIRAGYPSLSDSGFSDSDEARKIVVKEIFGQYEQMAKAQLISDDSILEDITGLQVIQSNILKR